MSCAGYVIVYNDDCTKIVEVTTTNIVKVVTEGPAGPARLPEEIRVDTLTAAGTIYVGRADNGTAESSPNWTIVKTTYSAAGVQLTKGSATAVNWTNRTSHTYT